MVGPLDVSELCFAHARLPNGKVHIVQNQGTDEKPKYVPVCGAVRQKPLTLVNEDCTCQKCKDEMYG